MSNIKQIEPNLSESFSDIVDSGKLLVNYYTGGFILGSSFNSAAGSADRPETLLRPAISKETILPLIQDAINNQRIEPYLATLLLVTNLGQPIKYRGKVFPYWGDFFPALIKIHNDDKPSFNAKRRHFLKSLQRCRFATHQQLDACGLMKNFFDPKKGVSNDSVWTVLVSQDDKVPHDRRPTNVNRNGVLEFSNDDVQSKSYAAIPKKTLLPLIKDAIREGRMSLIQASLMIAINAHAMELRNDDTRYIDHVMAVAANPSLTMRQSVVAILHDVLENSLWTAKDLQAVGYDADLINSVEHLTKRNDERVYLHFIQRVSTDPDALAVKIADIEHNSLDLDPKEDWLRLSRYKWALSYLNAVKNKTIEAGSSIEDYVASHGSFDPILFRVEPKKNKELKPILSEGTFLSLPPSSDSSQTGTSPA